MDYADSHVSSPDFARAPQRTLDAAECRRLEQRLRESEMLRASAERQACQLMQAFTHLTRMTMLADLWASFAHDLAQPVTAILSNAQTGLQLLPRGRPEAKDLRPILEDIADDAERARDLFRRVRELLKAGRREREEVDLNEVVRDTVVLLRAHAVLAKVDVSLRLSPTLPRIIACRVQIQQVIVNLMVNAFDAMQAMTETGRRLELATEQASPLTVKVSLRDTGRGMSDADRRLVFCPRTSSKAGGLGMGLFVSQAIVQAHGGRIWIENNPDRGVTASFSLRITGATTDE